MKNVSLPVALFLASCPAGTGQPRLSTDCRVRDTVVRHWAARSPDSLACTWKYLATYPNTHNKLAGELLFRTPLGAYDLVLATFNELKYDDSILASTAQIGLAEYDDPTLATTYFDSQGPYPVDALALAYLDVVASDNKTAKTFMAKLGSPTTSEVIALPALVRSRFIEMTQLYSGSAAAAILCDQLATERPGVVAVECYRAAFSATGTPSSTSQELLTSSLALAPSVDEPLLEGLDALGFDYDIEVSVLKRCARDGFKLRSDIRRSESLTRGSAAVLDRAAATSDDNETSLCVHQEAAARCLTQILTSRTCDSTTALGNFVARLDEKDLSALLKTVLKFEHMYADIKRQANPDLLIHFHALLGGLLPPDGKEYLGSEFHRSAAIELWAEAHPDTPFPYETFFPED